MTTTAHNTNNNNPANVSVTDKSIHLLNKCLDHQRHRFDHARLKAHQAALVLRAQSRQLEGLNKAITSYQLGNCKTISHGNEDISTFRKLLQDVRNLQKNQVEREEQVYQVCQEEALSAHKKVKTMEKLLEKMSVKQLNKQACNTSAKHLS
ncbi:hypothetical protein M3P05_17890 [Sansalvadorimonas sp. 2012CJ34-2]|uniref:Flagellar FliJ protein n=1 Tax=Parendozoicomonas callyspongiae TaxID=2942213 RepID=A0ABT0PK84_9GAMM|nr:hypothetical protein [Sansalvadorimonas sp. 2012CJ34-2]MCL6271794.1 hypothetical protein [Sansalvadorimonas sp. 2012CJ34-2]